MGGHSSNSSSNQQSSFNQNIPQFQQDALTNLYNNASDQFGAINTRTNRQIPTVQNYVNTINQNAKSAYNKDLQGGVYGGLNIGNQLSNSLQQSLNSPTNTQKIYGDIMGGNGNNYADAMKASYLGDANRATDNMLSNLDARAAASGMSGGSRHGVATSQGMYDINSNLQKNLAQTGYDTFNQDLNNKLGIAQQADQGTLARQQMMEGMLGQQQGTTTNAINQGGAMQNLGMGTFAPTMIPWQNMSNYSNVIGAPTVLSNGQSSGTSSSKGGGGGILTS